MRRAILMMAGALLITGGASADEQPVSVKAEGRIAVHAAPAAPLTARGWRAIRTGMRQEQVIKILGPVDVDDSVTEGCAILTPKRGPKGLEVMLNDGVVSRVTIYAPSRLKTDKGLGIGATEAQVRAAYAKGLVAEAHAYIGLPARYLTVWTIRKKAGVRYETDERRRVTAIHVGGEAIEYIEGCA